MKDSPSQDSIWQNVKTQLVEIPVNTITSPNIQFKFPTQDFLREKYIVSIETYNVQDVSNAPNSGNALITAANMITAFLTLYEQNPESKDAQGIPSSGQGQWDELIPLTSLHRVQATAGTPFVRQLHYMVPRIITWEKSYVQLASGTLLGNATPVSFLFKVGYIGNAGDSK